MLLKTFIEKYMKETFFSEENLTIVTIKDINILSVIIIDNKGNKYNLEKLIHSNIPNINIDVLNTEIGYINKIPSYIDLMFLIEKTVLCLRLQINPMNELKGSPNYIAYIDIPLNDINYLELNIQLKRSILKVIDKFSSLDVLNDKIYDMIEKKYY